MWGAIIAGVVALAGMLISGQQNKNQAERQQNANMDLAKFQAGANEDYLDKQLEYNSPENQMTRFQKAGLNPNLIYGQGSPGNQQAPLTFPDIKAADYQKNTVEQGLQTFNQTRLVSSQVNAQNATTRQKVAQVSLMKLQEQVLAKNPLLNDAGFKATIAGLISASDLKTEQLKGQRIKNFVDMRTSGERIDKAYAEVQLLEQKFKLGEKDQHIKAEILKSKEFQNAILEVQKKFMTDAEVTPQHILQFVQLLLMKIL